jgi:hypothetical protein
MSNPVPTAPPLVSTNPIEGFIASFNTNSYFIGFMMLILNLGGRHLVGGLTPEQDKFFQTPWTRKLLLFVVIFIATRNIFAAFWLSIAIIVILGYLTNETSSFYLFGDPVKPAPPPPPPEAGLTSEENEMFKRLQEKVKKLKEVEKKPEEPEDPNLFLKSYVETMRMMQH